MGHFINKEEEVFEGKEFTEISIFLEQNLYSFKGINSLEEFEILHEEDEWLKCKFSFVHYIESFVVFSRLDVWIQIIVVNFF